MGGILNGLVSSIGSRWPLIDELSSTDISFTVVCGLELIFFLVLILKHPRTWEGQFKSGIQTIAVVAVHEGVLQLGSTQKVLVSLNHPTLIHVSPRNDTMIDEINL